MLFIGLCSVGGELTPSPLSFSLPLIPQAFIQTKYKIILSFKTPFLVTRLQSICVLQGQSREGSKKKKDEGRREKEREDVWEEKPIPTKGKAQDTEGLPHSRGKIKKTKDKKYKE